MNDIVRFVSELPLATPGVYETSNSGVEKGGREGNPRLQIELVILIIC